MKQEQLFSDVLGFYADNTASDNTALYNAVAKAKHVEIDSYVKHVGKDNNKCNTFKRTVRWVQQGLKQRGLIERIGHNQWRITHHGKHKLTEVMCDKYLVAASTDLGAIVWGSSPHVFANVVTEDIHLLITSPPYLNIERSYGTYRNEDAYIDFILSVVEPIRKRMVPGANIALNLSNDCFIRQAYGERSLYLEMLTLRICKELDVKLMDRMVWHCGNKAPGPTQYVSKQRTHLNTKYEPILWFCTEPKFCLADNNRIKQSYSKSMKKLIAQGGEKQLRARNDSLHQTRKGSFCKDNGGAISGNVISIGYNPKENTELFKYALANALPKHGALYPAKLANLLIRYLCPEDGMVIDPFGGYSTSGQEAEKLGIRWLTCELHWEYIKTSLLRFKQCKGYFVNPLLEKLDDPMLKMKYAAA